jgi:hypothetical protein
MTSCATFKAAPQVPQFYLKSLSRLQEIKKIAIIGGGPCERSVYSISNWSELDKVDEIVQELYLELEKQNLPIEIVNPLIIRDSLGTLTPFEESETKILTVLRTYKKMKRRTGPWGSATEIETFSYPEFKRLDWYPLSPAQLRRIQDKIDADAYLLVWYPFNFVFHPPGGLGGCLGYTFGYRYRGDKGWSCILFQLVSSTDGRTIWTGGVYGEVKKPWFSEIPCVGCLSPILVPLLLRKEYSLGNPEKPNFVVFYTRKTRGRLEDLLQDGAVEKGAIILSNLFKGTLSK